MNIKFFVIFGKVLIRMVIITQFVGRQFPLVWDIGVRIARPSLVRTARGATANKSWARIMSTFQCYGSFQLLFAFVDSEIGKFQFSCFVLCFVLMTMVRSLSSVACWARKLALLNLGINCGSDDNENEGGVGGAAIGCCGPICRF